MDNQQQFTALVKTPSLLIYYATANFTRIENINAVILNKKYIEFPREVTSLGIIRT